MIVALHADAGEGIGLGHVLRCAALAVALQRCGLTVVMLNGAGPAVVPLFTRFHLPHQICDAQADAVATAARACGAVLLVADSYRLDRQALAVAAKGLKLAWFDDTATALPLADIIINGSPAAASLPYRLPADVTGLFGARYQVVRPDVAYRPRLEPVRRLLVTYGGSDPKAVGPLLATVLPAGIDTDFVVGPFAPVPANLPPQACLHQAPPDMPALMATADLALCAGGQTLFELAAAGIPAIAIGIGADQKPNLDCLEREGALLFAGWAGDPALAANLRRLLTQVIADSALRRQLAERAHALIDGHGAERIAAMFKSLL